VSRKTTAEDIRESRRVPEQAEVKAILEEYFVGPITDQIASKLTEYVRRVMADGPLHGGEIAAFDPGNGRRGFGQAWRELLSFDRNYPRSIDLAAWLAASTHGYPAPLPYCPDRYVGRWKQLEPDGQSGYTWEFEAGGRFRTDNPVCSSRDRWCVHRVDEGPRGDDIRLDDELGIAHDSLLVIDVRPGELVMQPVSSSQHHRLVRV
jgi:hypothetical protein